MITPEEPHPKDKPVEIGSNSLDQAQLDRLEVDGYLVIHDVLSAEECDELSAEMQVAWEAYDSRSWTCRAFETRISM
jgi:hypothetical protein